MGYAASAAEVTARYPSVPKIGFVAPPMDAAILTGETVNGGNVDLTARMVSMGNVHRALPLTGVLGFAVAARIAGTVVHARTRATPDPDTIIRIAHPSGIVEASAKVVNDGGWHAEIASVRRTQRRLFDGFVYVPASSLAAPVAEAAD